MTLALSNVLVLRTSVSNSQVIVRGPHYDNVCDVPLCNNPTSLEAFKEHSEIIVNSYDDNSSSDDDSPYGEDIDYVDALSPDVEIVSLEIELDPGDLTSIDLGIRKNTSTTNVNVPLEDDILSLFTYVSLELLHHRSGHHLEKNVKTGKSRRRPRIVLSEDEDAAEDSSKQGRKISDIDTYPIISLVQPHQDMEDIEYDFDGTASIPVTTAGLKISTTNIAVSTDDAAVTTASASISTVSPPRVSTTEYISGAETLVYIRIYDFGLQL
ncbi:hypothetical protein Tco_0266916 [Tanacetum coccineum]